MSKKEMIGAHIPKLKIYPCMDSTSHMPKRKISCSIVERIGSTKTQIAVTATRGRESFNSL